MNNEAAFHAAMSEIYSRARSEYGYNPSYFLQMLGDLGGLQTARQLLSTKGPSEGFTKLWELGGLDLTVEALVLRPQWRGLFTDTELRTAHRRLEEYGYHNEDSLPRDELPGRSPAKEGAPVTLASAVQELNAKASKYRIGRIQEIRKVLKQLRHTGVKTIFAHPMNDEWVYHSGGRNELQFNVGFEPRPDDRPFRHGVGFSLEASQSLPNPVEVLLPKLQRFNEFFKDVPGAFEDMRLWIHTPDGWSPDYRPRMIAPEEAVDGNFIFLGTRYPAEQFNAERTLEDFDRLLELYEFVEAPALAPRKGAAPHNGFRAGHRSKAAIGVATTAERTLSIEYRHNVMQDEIYKILVKEYGVDAVGTEWDWSPGVAVDIAVLQGSECWFYELKTAPFARTCIRQALAQLLEYAYWPGAPTVTKLIIVGEAAPDEEARGFLIHIRSFGIPVFYQHYVSVDRRLEAMV